MTFSKIADAIGRKLGIPIKEEDVVWVGKKYADVVNETTTVTSTTDKDDEAYDIETETVQAVVDKWNDYGESDSLPVDGLFSTVATAIVYEAPISTMGSAIFAGDFLPPQARARERARQDEINRLRRENEMLKSGVSSTTDSKSAKQLTKEAIKKMERAVDF